MSELKAMLILQLFNEMTDIAVGVSPDPHDRLLLFYVYTTFRQSRGTLRANASMISRRRDSPTKR